MLGYNLAQQILHLQDLQLKMLLQSIQVIFLPEVDRYDAGYFMIQVHDTTNDHYEFLEYIVVDDHIEGETVSSTFDTEFANIQTHSGLGTFGCKVITNSVGLAATTQVFCLLQYLE